MDIHILGLFPDILDHYFSEGLLAKARFSGLIGFYYHQLRDWCLNEYGTIDDKPYGGGSGMVFRPDVVCPAVRELKQQHAIGRVVLTSPAGTLLTAQKARELSQQRSVLFLCGRYEGVDERASELVVDEEISVGDYVLSCGELAAAVIIDALCRFVPGVVGDKDAVEQDSHEHGLLEYPHYTRPEKFEDIPVPQVLLSGHHAEIAKWRRQESLRRTWQRRPDLLKKATLSKEDLDFIQSLIHK